jgi:hypothetical protein
MKYERLIVTQVEFSFSFLFCLCTITKTKNNISINLKKQFYKNMPRLRDQPKLTKCLENKKTYLKIMGLLTDKSTKNFSLTKK